MTAYTPLPDRPLSALAMIGYVLLVRPVPALARFDSEVPEALPDDLVGRRERQRRTAALPVATPIDGRVPARVEENAA